MKYLSRAFCQNSFPLENTRIYLIGQFGQLLFQGSFCCLDIELGAQLFKNNTRLRHLIGAKAPPAARGKSEVKWRVHLVFEL